MSTEIEKRANTIRLRKQEGFVHQLYAMGKSAEHIEERLEQYKQQDAAREKRMQDAATAIIEGLSEKA